MDFIYAGILIAIGAIIGGAIGYDVAMGEAFDKGYAVECLNAKGYFWECK